MRLPALFSWRRPKPALDLTVDTVGACNLRCKFCAVGSLGAPKPEALMSPAMFGRIVRKAKREYQVGSVYPFHFSDPLLHPDMPEMIRLVRAEGLNCGLSTNLNINRNLRSILAARPNHFRISVSGFTQQVYGHTHAKGDIERVKKNLIEVRQTLDALGSRATCVEVQFIKFKHNVHEVEPMRRFTENLGFTWAECWAFYQPLNWLFEFVEGTLPEAQRDYVENLLPFPLPDSLALARRHQDGQCFMLDHTLVIDVRGNARLCCLWFENDDTVIGSFLSLTAAEIERRRRRHRWCGSCQHHGFNKLVPYKYYPELRPLFDDLAARHVAETQARRWRRELPLAAV